MILFLVLKQKVRYQRLKINILKLQLTISDTSTDLMFKITIWTLTSAGRPKKVNLTEEKN